MASGDAHRLDALGLVLLVVLVGWVVAVGGPGTRSLVVLLLALPLAVGAGRTAATVRRYRDVPAAVALAVLATLVLTFPGVLGAAGAPTGYANANATLVGLGALAALACARRRPSPAHRPWWLVAAALAVALALTGSVAGLAFGAVAAALALLVDRTGWSPWVVVGGPICVAVALAVTVAVAIDDGRGFSEVDPPRRGLWAAAADITVAHPWSGVGVNGFEAANPVTDDRDLRWAHHEYLQVSAELGVTGLALTLALIGWAYVRLWRSVDPAGGGAALTLVALHGTVDHVWHRPAVLLVVAVLIGAATSREPARAARPLPSTPRAPTLAPSHEAGGEGHGRVG